MATTIETALDRIVVAIAAATVLGGYHFDLNATDAVGIGRPGLFTPNPPQVWIEDWEPVVKGIGQGSVGANPMTMDEVELEVQIIGYAACTDNLRATRSRYASRILSDIHKAIASNRSLTAGVLFTDFEGGQIPPESIGLKGDYAAALAVLRCTYHTRGGL